MQVAGNSYYIQSPAKIGLYKLTETDVCLIDSGKDNSAGRKVRQLLDANGWHLKAIYNTHSRTDPTADATPLAQYNIDKMREVAGKIFALCGEAFKL